MAGVRERLARWVAPRSKEGLLTLGDALGVDLREPFWDGASRGPRGWGQRSFDAARTSRLNRDHWSLATGESLNAALEQWGPTLRKRCTYEGRNNDALAGAKRYHVAATVGAHGPRLQASVVDGGPDGDRFARDLEALFSEWAEMPDRNGQLSLVDFLEQRVHALWDTGDFLVRFLNRDGVGPDEIGLRLLSYPSVQLGTPILSRVSGVRVLMGVELSSTGAPEAYHLLPGEDWRSSLSKSVRVPAAYMLHNYHIVEPGQVRGLPMSVPALQTIATLRDFDEAVLEAARFSAKANAWLRQIEPGDEDGDLAKDEVFELEPGTLRYLPDNYDIQAFKSDQPAQNYKEFRQEKLRSIGLPVGISLLGVMLDGREHNYSSARLDIEQEARAWALWNGRTERQFLNPVVRAVAEEGWLRGLLPALPRGARLKLSWTHPKMPQVDAEKAAKAVEIRLKNRTTSLTDVLHEENRDVEELFRTFKREEVLAEELGVDISAVYTNASGGDAGEEPDAGAAGGKEEEGEGRG